MPAECFMHDKIIHKLFVERECLTIPGFTLIMMEALVRPRAYIPLVGPPVVRPRAYFPFTPSTTDLLTNHLRKEKMVKVPRKRVKKNLKEKPFQFR